MTVTVDVLEKVEFVSAVLRNLPAMPPEKMREWVAQPEELAETLRVALCPEIRSCERLVTLQDPALLQI